MNSKMLLFLVLGLFATTHAFNTMIPEGKELVYKYRALMRTGTFDPMSYASAFILTGKLHIQGDGNSSFVRLSELKYKMRNGKFDEYHEFDTLELPMPKEMEAMEKTFRIVYEPSGQAMGIAVEENEDQYIVNMKRGLATILSLNTEKLKWDAKDPAAFTTKENSVFGEGRYMYNLIRDEKSWLIQKSVEPRTHYHLYKYLSTNEVMEECELEYSQPITRGGDCAYNVVERDGHKVIDTIDQTGGIFYTPMQGQSVTMHIYMNTSMELLTVDAVKEPAKLTKELYRPELTYFMSDFESTEGVSDITNGRRKVDMNKISEDVEKMLYNTVNYLKGKHLEMIASKLDKDFNLNGIHRLTVNMDTAALEALTGKLMQKTGEDDKSALIIWYHMLPMIGSHASYNQIMKMIKDQRVKSTLAVQMLQSMSHYVKEPTSKLVDHMSEMLDWPQDLEKNVRKAAVLAFSTMVQKSTSRHREGDRQLAKAFPTGKSCEKYVEMIGAKLKATKTMEWKLVYMTALHNMGLESGMHILMPIVKGEMFRDEPSYIRFMAIMSIGNLMDRSNEELIFETLWPIMTDLKLQTSLRIAAYYQIMRTAPSLQRLLSIYRRLVFDTDSYMYQFHYTYMKAMSETTNPCLQQFRTNVRQLMRYTQKPVFRGLTGFHVSDFTDTKYDYAFQFSGMMIETPWTDERILKFRIASTREQAQFPLMSVMMRAEGIEPSIFQNVMLNLKDKTRTLNFDKLVNALRGLMTNKDLKVDLAVMRNGMITMWYHICSDNIEDLKGLHDFIFGDKFSFVNEFFTIDYVRQNIQLFPTDMGLPAMFVDEIPKMTYIDYNINKEVANKMITYQYDVGLYEFTRSYAGLKVYNPFADAFQGVIRKNIFEKLQPLYLDLSINPTQQSMKLSWKFHEDPAKDVRGVKSLVSTHTFVEDHNQQGILKKSSPEDLDMTLVTLGDEYRHSEILNQEENQFGYTATYAKYDSERYMRKQSLLNSFDQLNQIYHSQSHLGHMMINYIHLMFHMYLQPEPYTNGIIYKMEPSKTNPLTSIDVNLRVAREYTRGEKIMLPQAKRNARATISFMNHEKRVRGWDINMNLDTNMGHTLNNFKMVISRTGDKDMRICVDSTMKQTEMGIDAMTTVAMTKAGEAACTADDKLMEIHVLGEQSEEQKDGKHYYRACQDFVWLDIENLNTLQCYLARDSLRKWTYDIKTFDMRSEMKEIMKMLMDKLRNKLMTYASKSMPPTITDNSMKMIVKYPMEADVTELQLSTKNEEMLFSGIPVDRFLPSWWHMAQSRHFSGMFRLMHAMDWNKVCFVDQNNIYTVNEESIVDAMPSEWTSYKTDAKDGKNGIWLKRLQGDLIGFRMVHGENSLEIIPTKERMYEISVNGKKMEAGLNQIEDECFYVDWVKETGVVSILCTTTGSHIMLDGHRMFVLAPSVMDATIFGRCAMKQGA